MAPAAAGGQPSFSTPSSPSSYSQRSQRSPTRASLLASATPPPTTPLPASPTPTFLVEVDAWLARIGQRITALEEQHRRHLVFNGMLRPGPTTDAMGQTPVIFGVASGLDFTPESEKTSKLGRI